MFELGLCVYTVFQKKTHKVLHMIVYNHSPRLHQIARKRFLSVQRSILLYQHKQTRISLSIREAPARRQVLPPSEWQ